MSVALLFIGGYGDADAFKAQPQDACLHLADLTDAGHPIGFYILLRVSKLAHLHDGDHAQCKDHQDNE